MNWYLGFCGYVIWHFILFYSISFYFILILTSNYMISYSNFIFKFVEIIMQ